MKASGLKFEVNILQDLRSQAISQTHVFESDNQIIR